MESKYFKNIEEFENWLTREKLTFEEMIQGRRKTDEEIIKDLIDDGYTDLDNLVLDGHGYQIGNHANNGWLYEDEVDMYYVKSKNIMLEIRKRN